MQNSELATAAEAPWATAAGVSATPNTAVVIYNPIKVDLDDLRAEIGRQQHAAGWSESIWIATSEEDPGQGAAIKAIEAGASIVIAAGGDGTVRAIAEGLRQSSIPIALVPSGTGNLLARNLGLTLDDPEHSISTAFLGKDRHVDLGVIDIEHEDNTTSTHAFVVMAGLGLDAKMLANTDDNLKKKAGWLAYAKALSLTLRDKNELRFTYTLNERADSRPQSPHDHRGQLRRTASQDRAFAKRVRRRRRIRCRRDAPNGPGGLGADLCEGSMGKRSAEPRKSRPRTHDKGGQRAAIRQSHELEGGARSSV